MFQVYVKEFTTHDGKTSTRLRIFQGPVQGKMEYKGQLFIDGAHTVKEELLRMDLVSNAIQDDT